jgi:hypothetical protein
VAVPHGRVAVALEQQGAVVARENNERFSPQTLVLEHLKHACQTRIHCLDHGIGDSHGFGGVLALAFLVFLHERLGG